MKKNESFFMKSNRPTTLFLKYGFFIFSFSRPQDSCADGEGRFKNLEKETFCVPTEVLKNYGFLPPNDEGDNFKGFIKNPNPDYIKTTTSMFTNAKFETRVCNKALYQDQNSGINYCVDNNIPSPANTCVPSVTDPLATTKNAQCPPGHSPSFSMRNEDGSWIARTVPMGSMKQNPLDESSFLEINGVPVTWINVDEQSQIKDANMPDELRFFLDENCTSDTENTVLSILCPDERPNLDKRLTPAKIQGADFFPDLDSFFEDTTSCSSTGVSQNNQSLTLHLPGACTEEMPFCDKRCLMTRNENIVGCNCASIVGNALPVRQNAHSTQDYYTIGIDGRPGFSDSPHYIEVTDQQITRIAQNFTTNTDDFKKALTTYLKPVRSDFQQIIEKFQQVDDQDKNLFSNGCGIDGKGQSLACKQTNCQEPFSHIVSLSDDGKTKFVQQYCFNGLFSSNSWNPDYLQKVSDPYQINNNHDFLPQNVYENQYFQDLKNDTAKNFLVLIKSRSQITKLSNDQYGLVSRPYEDFNINNLHEAFAIAVIGFYVICFVLLLMRQFSRDFWCLKKPSDQLKIISEQVENKDQMKLFKRLWRFTDKEEPFLEKAIDRSNEIEKLVDKLKTEKAKENKSAKEISKLIKKIQAQIEKQPEVFGEMQLFADDIHVKDIDVDQLKKNLIKEDIGSDQLQGPSINQSHEIQEESQVSQEKSNPVGLTSINVQFAGNKDAEYKKIIDALTKDLKGEEGQRKDIIETSINILKNEGVNLDKNEDKNQKILNVLIKCITENFDFAEQTEIVNAWREHNKVLSPTLVCILETICMLINLGIAGLFIYFSVDENQQIGNQPNALVFPLCFLTTALVGMGALLSIMGYFFNESYENLAKLSILSGIIISLLSKTMDVH